MKLTGQSGIISVTLIVMLGVTGCANYYRVGPGYYDYVQERRWDRLSPRSVKEFPHIKQSAKYYLDAWTRGQKSRVQTVIEGVENEWVVDLGTILEAHLRTEPFKSAFEALAEAKTRTITGKDLFLDLQLRHYHYAEGTAQVTMRIRTYRGDRMLLDRTIEATGSSEKAQGSADATKVTDAIRESTMKAFDKVLLRYLRTLQKTL